MATVSAVGLIVLQYAYILSMGL